MTASSKTYFISGANRGIGFGLVKQLSGRPNVEVIATARNPEQSAEIQAWIRDHPNVHLMKYDAAVPSDALEVANQVERI
jgi:norsolorinic acid ketoreductase